MEIIPTIKNRALENTSSAGISPAKNSKSISFFTKLKHPELISITTIILVLVTATYFFAISRNSGKQPESDNITGFEKCLEAGGNVQKGSPETCIDKDGQSYVQEYSENGTSKPVNGEVVLTKYTNQILGISLAYPVDWGEPAESGTEKRIRVIFASNLTIEKGQYFELSSDTPLTFQQFVDRNTPFNKTVLDHTVDNIAGKRFIYQIGESVQETLIALPLENNEILTISFKTFPTDMVQNVLISKAIASIEIKSVSPVDENIKDAVCIIGGCNGEVCSNAADGAVNSICIYRPEYACYKSAECEVQTDGKCGWTQTPELSECLINASASTQ